jgi:putative spermidine/putrescine transport system substrate-binding protein
MTTKLTFSLASLLATTGIVASPVLAQDTTTVNVVGFSGVFAENYERLIIAPFEEANPGIDIVYQPSRNSAETLALLTLQRSDPTVDVALIDVSVAIRANEEGLFASLSTDTVPNLTDMPDWARIDDDRSIAFSQDNLVILYNTETVTEPPTSWNDLKDPRYQGRIAARLADTRGVILIPILTRMAGGDYKESIDPAIEAMNAFGPNVSTWEPAPDCYAVVQSGEVDLSICWNGRAQYLHDTQGGIIGIAAPVEGSIGQTNTINLIEGSQVAEAAQAFINYAISPEAQTIFAEQSFYAPVNTKVELAPEVAARIYGTPDAQAAQMTLDWPWISTVYSEWIQRINREVIAFN